MGGRDMKKLLLCLCVMLTLCVNVFADSGPKPSVNVNVRGLDGERWYATLLSETDSTGPYSAFGKYAPPPVEFAKLDADPAWHALYAYEDADGYWFLQFTAEGAGDGVFRWTYYPPSRFKVLLYFPDKDAYVVSEVAERYAFDSYYAVDLREAENGVVPVVKSWDYGRQLSGLAFRVALTVAVELAVALAFGYRERRQLWTILWVNVLTQLLLNGLLDAAARFGNARVAILLSLLPLEVAVFVAEGLLYRKKLGGKPFRYSLAANAASFVVGAALAHALPGAF